LSDSNPMRPKLESSPPSPLGSVDLTTERWLSFRRERPAARLRLFCLPFAGGGARTYRHWSTLMPPDVEVCPIQPPGRENRIMEPPLSSAEALVEALDSALAPLLDLPFALLGYSMGATVAFEWAQRLRRLHGRGPELLVVAASPAPGAPQLTPRMFDLPDEAFKAQLHELAGTAPEVLASDELMEILLPLLRADFEIHDTYEPTTLDPLDCPVVAFGGRDDRTVPEAHLNSWREVTTGAFEAHVLPGDHFSPLHDDRFPDHVARILRTLPL